MSVTAPASPTFAPPLTPAGTTYVFTSESVSEGHPDKVSDYIADSILDAHLALDPKSRVACEVLVKSGDVVLAGEITSRGSVDYESVARQAIREIGYTDPAEKFNADGVAVTQLLTRQAGEIGQGVDVGGAGDQGIMFGYACKDTPEFMPAPLYYSHKILRLISEARHSGKEAVLGPDSKSQVTVRYENGKPVGATQIVVSHQHLVESMTSAQVRELVEPYVKKALPSGWINKDTVWHINPTGKFFIGGPDGDTGLTGRKIIVDTYGGAAPHGGGAFSGKDPTKVDRSAAYAARYLAKNVVAAGLADCCTIQLAYAIGVAKPLSVYVDVAENPNKIDVAKLETVLSELVDLSPRGIRKHLDLNKPIYARTSAYGHFGRTPEKDGGFSWEKTDLGDALKSAMA